jgi:hypothetical protein
MEVMKSSQALSSQVLRDLREAQWGGPFDAKAEHRRFDSHRECFRFWAGLSNKQQRDPPLENPIKLEFWDYAGATSGAANEYIWRIVMRLPLSTFVGIEEPIKSASPRPGNQAKKTEFELPGSFWSSSHV